MCGTEQSKTRIKDEDLLWSKVTAMEAQLGKRGMSKLFKGAKLSQEGEEEYSVLRTLQFDNISPSCDVKYLNLLCSS